jgi:hypothetical protein
MTIVAMKKPAEAPLFVKGAPAYLITLPFKELDRLSREARYGNQRPEELRFEKAHVNAWGPRHHIFAIAALPDGSIQLLDGYTRLLNIRNGRLNVPAEILKSGGLVFVHSVETADEAFAAYSAYNSADSAKKGADVIAGALRSQEALPETDWLKKAEGVSSAISIAFEGVRIGDRTKTLRKNHPRAKKIAMFAPAIKLLDSIVPKRDKFPAGFLAGALLALYRDGEDALSFFDRYNSDTFVKKDQVYFMIEALRKERKDNKMASSHANRHPTIVLGCYSSWKKGGLKECAARPKAMDRAEFIIAAEAAAE